MTPSVSEFDLPSLVKILVAEDEPMSQRMIEAQLAMDGYEVTVASDGEAALQIMNGDDPPSIAVIDWMMPKISGLELCQLIRKIPGCEASFLILLTAKDRQEDMILGLNSGADDYITKPFEFEELRARIQVGERVLSLQKNLSKRVVELERALDQVKHLEGLLPICLYCKKIRDSKNYWQQVENYIAERTSAKFSHSVCPECYDSIVKPELEEFIRTQTD